MSPTKAEPDDAVLLVVGIIARLPGTSELELVAALEDEGFSHLHAEKLCAFVPSAFAWALLRHMGVRSFPNHYIAFDGSGREVQLPIGQEHYFAAALRLASKRLEAGWDSVLTGEGFERVVNRSAELSAANRLLNSGASLATAELMPLRVFRIPAELAKEG
jgi:hypothetical protein